MPKDTKTLGNNKARACESLGFVHKKRLCQRFDTTSFLFLSDDYHFCPLYSSETVSFFLPFARRAANTLRPLADAILSRKPCLFFLFLLEG